MRITKPKTKAGWHWLEKGGDRCKTSIYMDENGNMWSNIFLSPEEIYRQANSLKNCYSCYNCENCNNCEGCSSCIGCVDCRSCVECTDSRLLESCMKCTRCVECRNCVLCTRIQTLHDMYSLSMASSSPMWNVDRDPNEMIQEPQVALSIHNVVVQETPDGRLSAVIKGTHVSAEVSGYVKCLYRTLQRCAQSSGFKITAIRESEEIR